MFIPCSSSSASTFSSPPKSFSICAIWSFTSSSLTDTPSSPALCATICSCTR